MSEPGNSQGNEGRGMPDATAIAVQSELPEYSVEDIKRSSARGGIVTFAAQAVSVGLQLASTIVLARFLRPTEYGMVAMVTAVTAFAGLFRDLGLSASTVQRQTLTSAQLNTLYWINVAMGALLTLAVAGIAPIVAWFYERPELRGVTIVLSLNFLIGSFGAQPGALLMRHMQFGRTAAANISGAAAGLTVSIVLALRDFGYWALVFGGIAGASVTALLTIVLSGWRFGKPVKGAGVRSMLRYGANITAFDVVNYFHRNLDNILIGRIWGADALGLYSRAYSLLMFPINNIRAPLNAVAFPAMSRLQTQPLQFRAYYRRVTSLVAFLSMPIMAYLFISADRVIEVMLGPKWMGVVPIFAALAVTGFIQPATTMFGLVVLSAGQGGRYLKLGIFNTICMCTGFIIGSFYGPLGVAVGYGAATYLTAYPLLYWTFKGSPINVRDFGEAIARPAIASLVAAGATYEIAPLVRVPHSIESLITGAILFSIVFIVVFLAVPGGKDEIRKLIEMKNLFRRADSAKVL